MKNENERRPSKMPSSKVSPRSTSYTPRNGVRFAPLSKFIAKRSQSRTLSRRYGDR